MNLVETVRRYTPMITMIENVYMDIDGKLHCKRLPAPGLWRFDGQVFYLPKGDH